MNPIICTWNVLLPKGNILVWPDGCRDLIAVIPKKQPPKVVCSGLDAAPRPVVCPVETRFVGVRLSPGVRFPWDAGNPDRMRGDVDLTRHLPFFGHGWSFRTDPEEILDKLMRQINILARPAPGWVAEYFGVIRTGRAGRVRSLSGRSMRRHLVQATGAPPRYWLGLARARQAGLEVSRSDASLASIAADHGYSDQAHMSREVRRWFGCTPTRLRENREQAVARLAAPDVFTDPDRPR